MTKTASLISQFVKNISDFIVKSDRLFQITGAPGKTTGRTGGRSMMDDKKVLLDHVDKIHTTEMGLDRIKRNLKTDTADVVEYCKNKILDRECNIYRRGKNWYCEVDNIRITVNAHSYTIITAHLMTKLDK